MQIWFLISPTETKPSQPSQPPTAFKLHRTHIQALSNTQKSQPKPPVDANTHNSQIEVSYEPINWTHNILKSQEAVESKQKWAIELGSHHFSGSYSIEIYLSDG